MDYKNNEADPAEEEPFPQMVTPDLDGCCAPFLECRGEKEMNFQTVQVNCCTGPVQEGESDQEGESEQKGGHPMEKCTEFEQSQTRVESIV